MGWWLGHGESRIDMRVDFVSHGFASTTCKPEPMRPTEQNSVLTQVVVNTRLLVDQYQAASIHQKTLWSRANTMVQSTTFLSTFDGDGSCQCTSRWELAGQELRETFI